jgi:hypothetical protein
MRVRRRTAGQLGFVQLWADRRFHRPTMEAFEQAARLAPSRWIDPIQAPRVARAIARMVGSSSSDSSVFGR